MPRGTPPAPRRSPTTPTARVPTLFSEVAAGHVDVVKRVLAANPAATRVRDARGATPLHAAAAAGQLDMVRVLLAAVPPAALDAVDAHGNTPLHVAAAAGGSGRVVRALLAAAGRAAPAAANAANRAGATPLHVAAAAGCFDAARELVAAGARRGATDGDGRTPAELAPRDAAHAVLFAMLAAPPASPEAAAMLAAPPASPEAAAGTKTGGSERAVSVTASAAATPRVVGAAPADDAAQPTASASTSFFSEPDDGTATPSTGRTRGGASSAADSAWAVPCAHRVAVVEDEPAGASPAASTPAAFTPPSQATAATAKCAVATSRVDGLEARVARLLASRVAADAAASEARDAAVAAIEQRVEAFSERVTSQDARVDAVSTAVTSLATKMSDWVDAAAADRDAQRAALDSVRADVTAAAAATRVVDTKLDGLAAAVREATALAKAAHRRPATGRGGIALARATAAAAPAPGDTTDGGAVSDPGGPPSRAAALRRGVRALARAHAPAPANAVESAALAKLTAHVRTLEERVAKGEGWDAAAQNFARGVGAELTRLRADGAQLTSSLSGVDARLTAAEAGLRMLHSYVSQASAAFAPEAVKKLHDREARVSAAAAALAAEARARKAAEAEVKRVKAACRLLQDRLDAVEARAAAAGQAAAAPPPRPRRVGCFGRRAKLGDGERRRLSTEADDSMALAVVDAAAADELGGETVVVEEA